MPITDVTKDPENLSLTIVADFPVSVRRLWDAYADPRQLEKFWGPPTYPATFTRHDLYPGGRSEYYMTGPNGEHAGGYWEYLAVEEGRSFEVRNGFADADGRPNENLPSNRIVFSFEETAQGARLIMFEQFDSVEDMETVLGMGQEEGLKAALGQADDVLTDLQSFAAGQAVDVQILSDTKIRCSRIIRGTVEQVWEAQHNPELLKRWLLGPDGWVMTEATVAQAVGDTYRYAWSPGPGVEGQAFAFTGELKESEPPHREVTREAMEGMEGPASLNETTLTPVEGGTLLTLIITYANAEIRDMVLDTGMASGMEDSYARLEAEVLVAA
ncbi:ATPase [Nesterenkonia sp. MY13]|uniref:ATPase n=1 Tax=Nesterenkonia sedimenti TaxID=1463632 RepID=A0A7X8TH00_9MICC|nr:SRPBCC family protein [Nesterenkonia sedimenti]NLS08496.1 ATPase [Nesterenkonia sedimenti]